MKIKEKLKIVTSGIFQGNPTFVLFIGMCAVLAVTNTFSSAFGMGIAVIAVLILSNVIISLIRKLVPDDIRIPVYIVVIAVVVTVIQMFMEAFTADLAATLGVYLPLVVVNCIILGRAEAYANKNTVLDSFLDGVGTGLGFLAAVSAVSIIREIVGTGAFGFTDPFTNTVLFQVQLFPSQFAIPIFVQNAGAFLVLGLLVALINAVSEKISKNQAKRAATKKIPVAVTQSEAVK